MVKEINEENYLTAIAAIRDILYMYSDLTSYGYFGHNIIETGSFDPFDLPIVNFLNPKVIHSALMATCFTKV
ncbi:MAG: hypothetical protein V7K92_03080 [Nostoc sp.]|uniref:hypothetical protein n=1 Tax=Nostoc sp. TaxID=1180 RepID=UPI002FF429E4